MQQQKYKRWKKGICGQTSDDIVSRKSKNGELEIMVLLEVDVQLVLTQKLRN